jgi:hypothetical protein
MYMCANIAPYSPSYRFSHHLPPPVVPTSPTLGRTCFGFLFLDFPEEKITFFLFEIKVATQGVYL